MKNGTVSELYVIDSVAEARTGKAVGGRGLPFPDDCGIGGRIGSVKINYYRLFVQLIAKRYGSLADKCIGEGLGGYFHRIYLGKNIGCDVRLF